jgi:uncharacterized protein YjiS (DUF1127 family)
LAGVWQAARAIARSIALARSERRIGGAIGELRALDERLLADIGLTRSHIAQMAFGAAGPKEAPK